MLREIARRHAPLTRPENVSLRIINRALSAFTAPLPSRLPRTLRQDVGGILIQAENAVSSAAALEQEIGPLRDRQSISVCDSSSLEETVSS